MGKKSEKEALKCLFLLAIGIVEYLDESPIASKAERDAMLSLLKSAVCRAGEALGNAGVDFGFKATKDNGAMD